MSRHSLAFLSFLLLLLAGGCTVPQRPIAVWPPPPDEPRLLWVNTVYSEDDFDKTGFQVFTEKLLGKPDLNFFKKPVSVASDGKGTMYVADLDLQNVRVYDFNKREQNILTKSPFRVVIGVAVDAAGRLYVVDAGMRTVNVFNPDRSPAGSFTHPDFKKPGYVAVNDALGRIYVTDTLAHKVFAFDRSGNLLFTFGRGGDREGALHGPQGIAVAPSGEVAVADTLNARVQIFDADGNFVRAFGERGDQPGQFEFPSGVAFDSEGHLYVADARKAALLVYSLDGTLLMLVGGERSAETSVALSHPAGIAIDAQDRLFITDRLNLCVVIWQYLSERSKAALAQDSRYQEWTRRTLEKRRALGTSPQQR